MNEHFDVKQGEYQGAQYAADMTDMRPADKPDWVSQVDTAPAFDLDADALLRAGEFPLTIIQDHLSAMGPGHGGLLRSTFDPSPLVRAIEQSGYECWLSEDCQGHTILRIWHGSPGGVQGNMAPGAAVQEEERFWLEGGKLHMDVRNMPPPMPMIAVLQFLDSGAHDGDLYIHTPHFPVHLLPELEERHVHWQMIADQPQETILRLSRDDTP